MHPLDQVPVERMQHVSKVIRANATDVVEVALRPVLYADAVVKLLDLADQLMTGSRSDQRAGKAIIRHLERLLI